MSSALLADAILVVHAAFVLFVVGGLRAIWIGIAARRRFAYNPRRSGRPHLAAIAFVAIESILGFMCPLTIWEDALRGEGDGQGFIQRWIHAWLFWSAPRVGIHDGCTRRFALLVAWTWVRHPPRRYEAD